MGLTTDFRLVSLIENIIKTDVTGEFSLWVKSEELRVLPWKLRLGCEHQLDLNNQLRACIVRFEFQGLFSIYSFLSLF